jgi:DNA repair exonuclease SbcCD ATPase subunit
VNLLSLRGSISDKLRALDLAEGMVEKESETLKQSKKNLRRTIKAQEIVQVVAQGVQQKAHEHITKIVSRCLKAVFGKKAYEFKIDFVRQRGKTEARLRFIRNENDFHPRKGTGGGVKDVASWALRLACVTLQKPKRRKILICDEPFKFLDSMTEYRENMKDLIESLSKELGFQFIFVTHDDTLEAGTVIRL